MAKNLFEVVQSLLLLVPLLAVVCATAMRSQSHRLKQGFLRAMVALFAFILLFAYLRDARIIKYKQMYNIYLLLLYFVSGLAYCAISLLGPNRVAGGPASAVLGLVSVGCLLLYKLPTILIMPFHFLGKDDSYFSSYFLSRLTGFLLALLVCYLLLLCIYKLMKSSGTKLSSAAFLAFFLLNAFSSFVSIVGIINSYYRKRIKLPAGLRTKLPQLIQAESIVQFVSLLFLAALALAFVLYNIRIHGEYANPAEHRKLKAAARNIRRWGTGLVALAACLCLDLTVVKGIANRIVELSPSEEYQLDGNRIFIPLTQVSDGHLHRFTWSNGKGKDIRFIIVQKKGTNFGIGFDACEICGNVGYYERKNEVICNRCDVVMNKSTIGLKGGCNPIPLDSAIEEGSIVILTEDLDKEAARF